MPSGYSSRYSKYLPTKQGNILDFRDHSCSVLNDSTFIMCSPAVSQSMDDNQFCWKHNLGSDTFEKSVKMNYGHTDAALVYYKRLDK